MKNLFNKSFFKFATLFIGILIVSFVFASIISNIRNTNEITAGAVNTK